MKQDYFDKLTQLFIDKEFDEKTYTQIIDKYNSWYDKLVEEGKTDEEIQSLLKAPEDVVSVFEEKLNTVQSKTPEENTILPQETIEDLTEALDEVVESQNEEPFSKQAVDPNLIKRTTSKGKTLFYKRRSFGGGFMFFVLFLLCSVVALPILFGIFAVSLTLSFASMLIFFTPLFYFLFINNFDSVAYIEQANRSGVVGNSVERVLSVPIDIANRIIEQLNQVTTFEFPVFLHTILISVFAFAFLLVFLFATFQFFKLNVSYFAYFFNKISLKRIKI